MAAALFSTKIWPGEGCSAAPDFMGQVREEVNWVKQFYAGNPEWLVLDQTYQSVEETSARILRVMSERLGEENSKWSGSSIWPQLVLF